jgi:hypothetical protein
MQISSVELATLVRVLCFIQFDHQKHSIDPSLLVILSATCETR